MIERAQVPLADLSIRFLQLVQQVFPAEGVNLIIDDTLVPRCAKRGPGIGIQHDARGVRPTRQAVGGAAVDRLGQEAAQGGAPVDAWFMRRSLILPLLAQQVRIIGQVRRDTALHLLPRQSPELVTH